MADFCLETVGGNKEDRKAANPQGLGTIIRAIKFVASKAEASDVLTVTNSPLIKGYLSAIPPKEHKETLPVSMAALWGFEVWICSPHAKTWEILMFGSFFSP